MKQLQKSIGGTLNSDIKKMEEAMETFEVGSQNLFSPLVISLS